MTLKDRLASQLGLAVDLSTRGQKQSALGLFSQVAEVMAAHQPAGRRDLFCMAALAGLCACQYPQSERAAGELVALAVRLGDGLLAALDG